MYFISHCTLSVTNIFYLFFAHFFISHPLIDLLSDKVELKNEDKAQFNCVALFLIS